MNLFPSSDLDTLFDCGMGGVAETPPVSRSFDQPSDRLIPLLGPPLFTNDLVASTAGLPHGSKMVYG
mgnify:CR=1 FL=1